MPYTRIWIHLIWSTKNREAILKKELRETIFQHITANAKEKRIYLDCINGYVDHVHTLIGLKADQSIAKVAQLLKGESSHWVNEEKLTPKKFEWQDEYIAVSVSESAIDKVRVYIGGQEEHHRKKSFSEEYQEFVIKYRFENEG
ncbi:MAG TPA: IS200/IS605 family transposase [Bacteroidota bacterium]